MSRYSNTDPIWKAHIDKLAKPVMDNKDIYNLKTGDKLDLGQGYTLEAKAIDVNGERVWLELNKDGQYVDDTIVLTSPGYDHNWTSCIDKVLLLDNVPVLKVHVNKVYQVAVDSFVQIDGIWLIDFANSQQLHIGDQFGSYTLTAINSGVNTSDLGSLIFNSPVPPILPVANFTSNVTSGYAPLTVQLTDLSTNASGWNWDFGDGNTSYEESPQHTFYAVKDYTVNLTANNGNGSDSKSITINVTAPPAFQAFPGCTNLSKDLDNDGLYEDINENERLDFADVGTYFNNMAWIPQHEPVSYFDYNRNGRIDFSDVVMLFNMKY
jgi:hypothetical protein